MLTGYVPFPRWRMMWEYHSEAYLPSVANARNRFEVLKVYAHFADNATTTSLLKCVLCLQCSLKDSWNKQFLMKSFVSTKA